MKKIFLFFYLYLFLLYSLNSEELTEWKISLKDSIENTKKERMDTNWTEIEIPINFDNFVNSKNQVIWLRKEIKLEKNKNYAILLDQVNGFVEVFFNEKLIGLGPTVPNGTLLFSIPMDLWDPEYNIISIKFHFKSLIENGIYSKILLLERKEAIHEYYKRNIKHLFISLIFAGSGLFLLFLFLKFSKEKYYLYLSLFYLTSSISCILVTPQVLDMLYFQTFFYNLAMALPVFLPTFFIRFFSLYFKYISKTYKIHKFDLLSSFILFFIILFIGFYNIYLSRIFNLLWLVLFILIFAFLIYLILLDISKTIEIKKLFILFFLTYLFAISLNSVLNFNYFREERFLFKFDVFFILIIPLIFVFWEIIQLQKSIEKKEEQFISFDILQTKLFDYILTALSVPIRELLDALNKINSKDLNSNQTKSLIYNIEDLEKNLNDILELSRLEVLEEPESYVEINVKDFLEAILNKSSISYTINVDPNLVLNTSLELVNSLLIRFIDFPGFGSFRHIDLVVLSENQQIYFRFFLYNTNLKIVNRIYNIIKEKLPDKEGLWIQWKIIKELIRILGGNLNIKLYSNKYLYIEFFISAIQTKRILKEKQTKKSIPLVYLYYLDKEESKLEKDRNIIEKIKSIFKKKIA